MTYFPEIMGNAVALSLLSQLIEQNNFPSSIMLRGPVGVGKFTVAEKLARLANCVGDRTPKCGCPSCSRFRAYVSPNCISYPRAVDKVVLRELQGRLGMRVAAGTRFVILRAENMDLCTQDMFLKILEEPVENASFIITSSTSLPKRPVISRSVVIQFSPCTQDEVGEFLVQNPFALTLFQTFDGFECSLLFALAGGSPGVLLKLMRDLVIRTKLGLVKLFFSKEIHPEFIHQLFTVPPTELAEMLLTVAYSSLYAQKELGIPKITASKVIKGLEVKSACPLRYRIAKLYMELRH